MKPSLCQLCLFLLLTCNLTFCAPKNYTNHVVLKMLTTDAEKLFPNLIQSLSHEFEVLWNQKTNACDYSVMRFSPKVFHRVKRNTRFDLLTNNFQLWIDRTFLRRSRFLKNNYVSSLVSNFRLDLYQPLDQIYDFITKVSRFDHVTVLDIGHTHMGKPIKAIQIKGNPNDNKLVWIDGTTHAREWITPSVIMYMVEKIITEKIKANFIIVPVINPDGYEYTWRVDRLWRKNLRPGVSRTFNKECNGVDLNRNYDINFGGTGSSDNPCSALYQGPDPFSEPETVAVAKLIWSLKHNIKLFLSLHSFNELWACPYAYTTSPSPYLPEHMNVLTAVQKAVYQTNGVRYEIGPLSTSLYVGSGFSLDWVYQKVGIVHSYLAELRDKGKYGFLLPVDQIIPTASETWQGLKAAMKKVM